MVPGNICFSTEVQHGREKLTRLPCRNDADADQLRQMEESGLLTRTVYPEVPPHVEYALTGLGCSLQPVLDALRTWGEQYKLQDF